MEEGPKFSVPIRDNATVWGRGFRGENPQKKKQPQDKNLPIFGGFRHEIKILTLFSPNFVKIDINCCFCFCLFVCFSLQIFRDKSQLRGLTPVQKREMGSLVDLRDHPAKGLIFCLGYHKSTPSSVVMCKIKNHTKISCGSFLTQAPPPKKKNPLSLKYKLYSANCRLVRYYSTHQSILLQNHAIKIN